MAGAPIAINPDDLQNLPPALASLAEQTTFRAAQPSPGASHDDAIASVDAGNPNVVDVEEPDVFETAPQQLEGHELTHIWQNNLPPTVQAAIPPDNKKAPYDISNIDALAARGATMQTIPHEQAATIVQKYIAGDAATKKQLQPWIDQLNDAPLSSLEPTAPDAKTINTTPRAPTSADAKRYEDQIAKELKAADLHNPPRGRGKLREKSGRPSPQG